MKKRRLSAEAEELMAESKAPRTKKYLDFADSMGELLKHSRGLPSKTTTRTVYFPLKPVDVKAFRRQMKLSQTQCARVLAVKPETVKKWEQGGNPVSGPAAQWMRAAQMRPDVVESLLQELVPSMRETHPS